MNFAFWWFPRERDLRVFELCIWKYEFDSFSALFGTREPYTMKSSPNYVFIEPSMLYTIQTHFENHEKGNDFITQKKRNETSKNPCFFNGVDPCFFNGVDAHHVDEAGMLDHVMAHQMSCAVIFITAQGISLSDFGFPTGMCASFGWEAAPFFDPFRSKKQHSTAQGGGMKRKPVIQESFPTHLPPPRICPKICFCWLS